MVSERPWGLCSPPLEHAVVRVVKTRTEYFYSSRIESIRRAHRPIKGKRCWPNTRTATRTRLLNKTPGESWPAKVLYAPPGTATDPRFGALGPRRRRNVYHFRTQSGARRQSLSESRSAPSGCFADRHAKTREVSSPPAHRFAYDVPIEFRPCKHRALS